MARRDIISAAKEGGPVPPSPEEKEASNKRAELHSPERQWEILNPKVLAYELLLSRQIEEELTDEAGRKVRQTVTEWYREPIHIATEFTIADIASRRIYDELEAYVLAISAEVRSIKPEFLLHDFVLVENMQFMEAAMTRHREMLRALIAKVSSCPNSDPKAPVRRPSVDDIAMGLTDLDLYIIGMSFMALLIKKADERKKDQAAARASLPPQQS
jgi:hypothetical protein